MEFLFSLPMTLISGSCLLWSLWCSWRGISMNIDPAWGAVLISGIPMLILALKRLIFQRWVSSALLISMAMVASLGIGSIFAAGEVAFIMALGGIFEEYTVERAKKGMKELIALVPEFGRRIRNGKEELVKLNEIVPGDVCLVLPGEKIPIDGIVVKGHTSVDQSMFTGESLPVDKIIGDEVFSGTMNCFGTVEIQGTHVGKDSSLEKLIRLVEGVKEKKAPMERITEKWAIWLVPIALGIGVFGFLWNLILGHNIIESLTRGVTVLIVFCPCALALATPITMMAAIGQATKKGVMVKSAEALETMAKVDVIAFDKTGTLTKAQLMVSDILPYGNVDEMELMTLVAAIEKNSEHPLAKAVVEEGKKRNLPQLEVESFHMIPGKGVQGNIRSQELLCGSKRFLEEKGILLPKDLQEEKVRKEGKALLYVALNQKYLGVVALIDTLRPEGVNISDTLEKLGVQTVLLTGDHPGRAEDIRKKCNIKMIFSELLPGEKVEKIEELKRDYVVAMVGDGLNDAPALKTAHVGVAMGAMGSDIAIDAADIALMNEDLTHLVYLKTLAKETVKTIKINIIYSLVINFVAIILSVAGVLNPVTGALVHNIGSVLVVLNGAALYDRKWD